jgi:hypothetical protein
MNFRIIRIIFRRRMGIYFFSAAISLFTTGLLLVELLYFINVRPQLLANRAIEAKYVGAYAADLQRLAKTQYLATMQTVRAGKADAGIFLNEKVHWAPQLESSMGVKKYGSQKPLVAASTREALLRLDSQWMQKHMRVENLKADLSLFTALDRFDYWDIEANSPIAELAEKHLYLPPAKLPFPDVQDLLAIGKLRLMHAAVNGPQDYVPALGDVRSLARLLLTTENQQLVMTGLSLLETERFAYNYFVKEMKMSPQSWIPTDAEDNRVAHRAILGTRGFLHLWTPTEIMRSIYLTETPPMGFCAAINEALPLEYALREVLEPQLPFEISLKSEYVALDEVYRRSHSICRLRYLGEMMAHNTFSIHVPGPLVLNRFWWARKVFGLRLSVYAFRGLGEYYTLTTR